MSHSWQIQAMFINARSMYVLLVGLNYVNSLYHPHFGIQNSLITRKNSEMLFSFSQWQNVRFFFLGGGGEEGTGMSVVVKTNILERVFN